MINVLRRIKIGLAHSNWLDSYFRIVDQECLLRIDDVRASIEMARRNQKTALQGMATTSTKMAEKCIGYTWEREGKQHCLDQGGSGKKGSGRCSQIPDHAGFCRVPPTLNRCWKDWLLGTFQWLRLRTSTGGLLPLVKGLSCQFMTPEGSGS